MRERRAEQKRQPSERVGQGKEEKRRIPKEIYKLYDHVTNFAQKAKHTSVLNLLGKGKRKRGRFIFVQY